MAKLSRSEAVIALGREIVCSLGEHPSLLTQWMAHFVAERLDAAEHAAPEERAASQAAAFEAVLELWRHRAELPNGSRPYQALEPVIETLKMLNPGSSTNWFFLDRDFERVSRAKGAQAEWLRFAVEIDEYARAGIRYCLGAAVDEIPPEAQKFAELSHLAFNADDQDTQVLRIILERSGGSESKTTDPAVARVQKALERVMALRSTIDNMEAKLRTQLPFSEDSGATEVGG
jgi:hypothetical protein